MRLLWHGVWNECSNILNHSVFFFFFFFSLCYQGENPFTDNQDDQDPEDSMMEVSEGDAELKQEGKQEEAEHADVVGEPEVADNGDGREEETKMEEGEGGVEEGEGGVEEGGEEEGKGGEEEEEEEDEDGDGDGGVQVKEAEPEGAEDVDDVDSILHGEDDDGGIPVIED